MEETPNLNAPSIQERLDALSNARPTLGPPTPSQPGFVNNHIHTTFSFSPYSPTKAAYMAWKSGLQTAGIMDHDTVSGALEFIEAGKILGISTTVGMECRCSMKDTPFAGLRINNPDQKSVAYLALHGIPHQNLSKVTDFITPYRAKRSERNANMTCRLNALFEPFGITLDYKADVVPISQAAFGGSVTERHILFALASKVIQAIPPGPDLCAFLQEKMKLSLSESNSKALLDPSAPLLEYILLNLLKSQLVSQFYIDATEELPTVSDFIQLAKETGAIAAYAYLGDVKNSVTGDKKDQLFEDEYLDKLLPWLKQTGFQAVTYMPARNTPEQLTRIMELCAKEDLFQISGEDINTPFQSFVCPALSKPEFAHLITSTWALVGHEKAMSNAQPGLFSPQTIAHAKDLPQRVEYFAKIGKGEDSE
jgi:hypothetical protein